MNQTASAMGRVQLRRHYPDRIKEIQAAMNRFCEAVRAEGVPMCVPGAKKPLHIHSVFHPRCA